MNKASAIPENEHILDQELLIYVRGRFHLSCLFVLAGNFCWSTLRLVWEERPLRNKTLIGICSSAAYRHISYVFCSFGVDKFRNPGPIKMKNMGKMGIHYLQRLNAENVPKDLIEKGQSRVIEASLTLIRERAKLKGELLRALGGAVASASLLGVPLGHNSSFLQGPAFAPPRIREAMWCGSTNSSTEEGKDLNDPRVLTDVGDVPVQELRDCGVDDDRLMNIISESVKLVMEEDPLRPLVLGGDHSISFPVVRAVSEKLGGPVDILHLDAHPDIYHAFEGNKYSHASSFARIMEGGYARRLLQVGIRSINKEGREQGKRFGVEQYEMQTFSRDRQLLENLKLGEGVKGVYISVDVDCLDPAFAPGVSHIEPGGLSFRDVLNILHNLKGDVVAADVVEFNPQRDTVDGMTAMVAAKLVRELTAKISK